MSIFENSKGQVERNPAEESIKVKEDSIILDPALAWDNDETLIALEAKYQDAKSRAEKKSDMLRQKIGEMLLSERNQSLNEELATGTLDEIIDSVDSYSNESGKNASKRYLLRKAAKAPWTDDKEYKQAAIEYLTYILPYLERLDEEVIQKQKELIRLRQMHHIEEMKITSKMSLLRTRISTFLKVHGLEMQYAESSRYDAEYKKDIAKSKRTAEAAIRILKIKDDPIPEELFDMNDKIFAQMVRNGLSFIPVPGRGAEPLKGNRNK